MDYLLGLPQFSEVVLDLCEVVAEAVALAVMVVAAADVHSVAVAVLLVEAKVLSFPHFQINFQVQARLQQLVSV